MKPPALRCLVTAGPTREHLDPVRFLSNGSSGKMGYALAAAAAARGWSVDLVSGPVSLPAPPGVAVHRVISADEMFAACDARFAACDIFIAVAAVADYRAKAISQQKQKKNPGPVTLELVPTIDILKTLAAKKTAGQTMVGFAAETNDVEGYARKKLAEKRLDWIVANDVSTAGIGMNADDNTVLLIGAEGTRASFGPAPKAAVADFILNHIRVTAPA
jgi:phosphopantothenoylcysteine decarboxylase/phosphopantothenate--cysteine ligase